MDNGRLHLVSLGQGQEGNAQFLLEKSSREGHWVILQNIHLVKRWLPVLERTLENCANSSSVHVDFKVFLSVQPPGPKGINVVPQVGADLLNHLNLVFRRKNSISSKTYRITK